MKLVQDVPFRKICRLVLMVYRLHYSLKKLPVEKMLTKFCGLNLSFRNNICERIKGTSKLEILSKTWAILKELFFKNSSEILFLLP